jgi:hypothetical protein
MVRNPRNPNPYVTSDWPQSYPPSQSQPAAGSDWASQWYTQTYAPLMDNLARMWGGMVQPMASPAQPWTSLAQAWLAPYTTAAGSGTRTQPHGHPHHHHGRDCGCEQGDCDGCGSERCDCRCCITDADLIIYARLGERRVVPVTIENPRRRERQIKLELSQFSTRAGSPVRVRASILGPAEFTLASCQEQQTVLVIEAAGDTDKDDNPPNTDTPNLNTPNDIRQAAATDMSRAALPDVEDCQVFYADLRVEGCETRPVRIALAVLPRNCDGFKVDCGCGCC